MMRHWDHDWGVGQWLVMGFGMLLFWGLLVALVFWVIRTVSADRADRTDRADRIRQGTRPDGPIGPSRATAQEILDERYARGEIGDEEYRTRRDILASRRSP